jgi:hypothetical protein
MKNMIMLIVAFVVAGCAELQQVAGQFPGVPTETEVAAGLKEALNNGISKQVSKLAVTDGFFKNEAVKIMLPAELQKVDKALRAAGLSSLADEGLKVLNRAAEDAVKEATPIFVDAVRKMTINDARNILFGEQNAATNYLQNATTTALYTKFNPIVKNSLGKVGADRVWANIIAKYNALPSTQKVNPNLVDYVTGQAMIGVFRMIAVEEQEIRSTIDARTSDLLRRVFALQDRNR